MLKSELFACALFTRLQEERRRLLVINEAHWKVIVADEYTKFGKRKNPKPPADPLKPPAPKPRNELFDAIAIATGTKNLKEITKSGGQSIGRALADIKAATSDVTVEEIARRAALYRQRHPQWTLTPDSLAKWWGTLGRGERTEASKNDTYVEPANWRPIALRIFHDALEWGKPHDFRTIGWHDFDHVLRKKVLDVINTPQNRI